MRRAHMWPNPQAQQEPTQRRGKIPARPPPNPARITIKGDLPWASILAQEGDHRFQRRLFVEILSGLGSEGNRSASIDPRCRRATTCWRLPCELCSGETVPTSLKSIWISSNGSRSSLGWGGSLERGTRQPVACRIFQIVRLERGRGTCAACHS